MATGAIHVPPATQKACKRSIASVSVSEENHCDVELDGHADTCAFVPNACVAQETGESASVDGFVGAIGTLDDTPIITAAVACDNPHTSQTHVLFFHQSLCFKSLTKHLVCPEQLRHHGLTVHDIPLLHITPEA